jgi:hypothetical protein
LEWEPHSRKVLQEMRNHLEELKRLGIEAINDRAPRRGSLAVVVRLATYGPIGPAAGWMPYLGRQPMGKTSRDPLAVATSLPLASVTVPSAKATRLPAFDTTPTQVNGPLPARTERR